MYSLSAWKRGKSSQRTKRRDSFMNLDWEVIVKARDGADGVF
jgi:hypothetical protein